MPTALRVPKAQAQQWLDEQTATGRTIHTMLQQDVTSEQTLREVRAQYTTWHESTIASLSRLFSDDTPVREFKLSSSSISPEPRKLEGRMRTSREQIYEDIRRLESLRGRLRWMEEVDADDARGDKSSQADPMPIVDEELRRRCADLLKAGDLQDRVIREACVVLEDRVRTVVGANKGVIGVSLMENAFGARGPLQLSTQDQEQVGAMQLYRGTMAFFRNSAGHHLVDITRDDARRFVAWVDLLLAMVKRAQAAREAREG